MLDVQRDPSQMPLAQLIACCAAERIKFRHGEAADPQYCLEIFRRALGVGTNADWDALHTCFFADVLQWVRYHPVWKTAHLPEAPDVYAHEAFERLLIANRNHPLDVTSLGAILSFLRHCVSSVVLDALRAQRKELSIDQIYEVPAPDEFEGVIGRLTRDELWQMVEQCLTTPRELRLAHALWIEGFRPREIPQILPDDFPDVTVVRRAEANIIDRLRRRYRPSSA
jgi:DNA-directed RNA polymerase specialized sigma24 family protein